MLEKVPACLPLTITVDRQAPRHRSLPVGAGECEDAPRCSCRGSWGDHAAEAVARLRQAGLRPAAYRGAIRYEPVGDGLGRRLTLPRALPRRPEAGHRPRRLPVQEPRSHGARRWRSGPSPPPAAVVSSGRSAAASPSVCASVAAGRGGRQLTLGLTGGACDPLDHVDVALRERWVLLMPFVIAGRQLRPARPARAPSSGCPSRWAEGPCSSGPPDVPDPSLVNQHPTPFDAARPSPDGRSVVVFYTYGGCESLAGSRVAERRETVELTLLQGNTGSGQVCPAIAHFGLALVRLPSPLGTRRDRGRRALTRSPRSH